MLAFAEVSSKCLLQGAFLVSDNLNQAYHLANAATAASDRATEAQYSQRVVDCLEELLVGCTDEQRPQEISKQRNAYLLRTVDYHLAPWNDLKDPEQDKALTYLFAGLADPHWPNGSIEVITTDQTRCSGATRHSKPGVSIQISRGMGRDR